jgi:hypothetical protein
MRDSHEERGANRPLRNYWRYHQRAGKSATVRITVRNLSHLFNSLDPSPFWDRDLDRAAADFIEDEFRDRQTEDPWHLLVQVQEGSTAGNDLQTALKSHYLRQANSARLALREHLWVAQLALCGGTLIFLLCMGGRALLSASTGMSPWAEQGLVILAWLALWRPAEALLYGWVPFYRRRRRYDRLAHVRVAVRLSASLSSDSAKTEDMSGGKAPRTDHSLATGGKVIAEPS